MFWINYCYTLGTYQKGIKLSFPGLWTTSIKLTAKTALEWKHTNKVIYSKTETYAYCKLHTYILYVYKYLHYFLLDIPLINERTAIVIEYLEN